MKANYGFTGTLFAFGLYGAFGFSFLYVLATWLFASTLFNDGQYGMSFIFTCPFGWLVGSLIGLVRVLRDKNITRPRYPLLISFGVISGGCITLPFFGMMFMLLFLSFIGAIIGFFTDIFK